jgi:predicted outer membrane repeat protein
MSLCPFLPRRFGQEESTPAARCPGHRAGVLARAGRFLAVRGVAERENPTRARAPLPHLGLVSALLFFVSSLASAAVLHVVPTGGVSTGDCSSWDSGTACRLAYAVNTASNAGDEVWVKQGIYRRGNVNGSFGIREGVKVYGGFLGTETSRSERNPDPALTILSGDVDNDDIDVDGNQVAETPGDIVGANAYHVVEMLGASNPITSATVLDGFTITAGDATGSTLDEQFGGGLVCDGNGGNCSPTLSNLRFVGNRATLGGGAIYLSAVVSGESSPEVTSVTFESNSAGSGGAIYSNASQGTSAPTFREVDFLFNSSTASGGLVAGGGAYFNNASDGERHLVFLDVLFEGNTAVGSGGALFDVASAGLGSLTFERAAFIDNSAGELGGAIYLDASNTTTSPLFTNVTFSGNDEGAIAIFRDDGVSDPRFVNSTFFDNTGVYAIEYFVGTGGGSGQVRFDNVISWGQEAVGGPASCTAQSSVVQPGLCSTGQITDDPLLQPLSDNGGRLRTHALGAGSPAIGSGDVAVCSAPAGPTSFGAGGVDQRAYERSGPLCDIGAFESDGLPPRLFGDDFESGDTSAWSSAQP